MEELSALEVLTTTRAIRRRMDFDRPVERETLIECIRIALQAPTGGGDERWRWLIVEDQEQKNALARLYRDAAMGMFTNARDTSESEQRQRVYGDAVYLAENFERVPAIVIPCSHGTPPAEPAGAAGFFGSILPAVWSFQLALRMHGMGSAYTTAVLSRSDDLRAILGIPGGVTPAAMIPVGYTKGTKFRLARRSAPEDVTFIDRWGQAPEQDGVRHEVAETTG